MIGGEGVGLTAGGIKENLYEEVIFEKRPK